MCYLALVKSWTNYKIIFDTAKSKFYENIIHFHKSPDLMIKVKSFDGFNKQTHSFIKPYAYITYFNLTIPIVKYIVIYTMVPSLCSDMLLHPESPSVSCTVSANILCD